MRFFACNATSGCRWGDYVVDLCYTPLVLPESWIFRNIGATGPLLSCLNSTVSKSSTISKAHLLPGSKWRALRTSCIVDVSSFGHSFRGVFVVVKKVYDFLTLTLLPLSTLRPTLRLIVSQTICLVYAHIVTIYTVTKSLLPLHLQDVTLFVEYPQCSIADDGKWCWVFLVLNLIIIRWQP